MTRPSAARELAAVLGVSAQTTLCSGRIGKLPGFRLPSGQLRFSCPPCGCCECEARARLAGAEPLKPERELRFELAPSVRWSGEAHPSTIDLPGTVTAEGVSTRWGNQLWYRDHDSAERWTARAAGARSWRGCYTRPGR